VNTASRLCGHAQAGQVLLSEATFAKVHHRVAAVALPPVRVRGKADELRVWNAIGMRDSEWKSDTTKPF
jgi:class 3 adenylate cyclase